MKMTRRKLAATLAAPALASASQTPGAPADPAAAARARIKSATEALAKQAVPMATEPAFQFKA